MRYDGSMDLKITGKSRAKLMELLGLPFEQVDSNVLIEYTVGADEFTEIRFLFRAKKTIMYPATYLYPKSKSACTPDFMLHGAWSGMHIALGRNKMKRTLNREEWPHRAMALRSIKEKDVPLSWNLATLVRAVSRVWYILH